MCDIGGRDQTKLVDGMHKQVAVVTGVVGPDITVHGVLCFVEADWPLIGGTFTTRGVQVLWPKKLYPKLAEAGPYDAGTAAELHARLAQALTSLSGQSFIGSGLHCEVRAARLGGKPVLSGPLGPEVWSRPDRDPETPNEHHAPHHRGG